MSKKAVVTGAAGYIGLVLCKMLKEQGYFVVGCDNAVPASSAALRFPLAKKYCDVFENVDFADDKFLDKHVTNDVTIFHLAAHSLLGPSVEEPIDYFFNNSVKTLKMFEYATRKGVKRIIFASTAAVYSEVQWRSSIFSLPGLVQMYKPVKEDEIIAPPNNYGMSKLHVEQYFDAYEISAQHYNKKNRMYGYPKVKHIQMFSFRFFNVIGGYDDVGPIMHTPHIISSLIRAYKKGETFGLNGDDFKTKDGSCIRDYVHVVDVCRAMMHADIWGNEKLADEKIHYKFNLGTGHGHSNKQVIDAFNRVISPHVDQPVVKVKQIGRRPGDPPYLVADPIKFIEDTGFTYKYSDNLEEMIKSAWRTLENV